MAADAIKPFARPGYVSVPNDRLEVVYDARYLDLAELKAKAEAYETLTGRPASIYLSSGGWETETDRRYYFTEKYERPRVAKIGRTWLEAYYRGETIRVRACSEYGDDTPRYVFTSLY